MDIDMNDNRATATLTGKEDPSRREVWKMFDRIAGRYDLLNRMLSFGQDVVWRNRVARHLPKKDNLRLLDLATGTADQLISIFKHMRQPLPSASAMLATSRNHLGKCIEFYVRTGEQLFWNFHCPEMP